MTNKKETGLTKVKNYMNNDVVKNSFVEILAKPGFFKKPGF